MSGHITKIHRYVGMITTDVNRKAAGDKVNAS